MKLLLLSIIFAFSAFGQMKLSFLLKLDDNFSKNVIVVEKSTHQLFIYSNESGEIKLKKTFSIASGKTTGNKFKAGDKKTPEGIYFLEDFYSQEYLLSKYGKSALIYGAGAFTLNYPNHFDRLNNKTGSGIWLHSTDNDSRISKGLDSKGCVVATDADIKEIANSISLKRTPIIIAQDLQFLKKNTWKVKKNRLENFFINWANSWRNKSFNQYISHYSKRDFSDPRKGNYKQYKNYKRYIFNKTDRPQIEFSDVSIMTYKNTAIISTTQDYKSNNINDVGRKVLYLKQNDKYEWKIVREMWSTIRPAVPMQYFAKEETNASN